MLRRFLRYLEKVYHFSSALGDLRDTRHHPCIPTQTVFGCVLLLFVLRLGSLNAFEVHYRWREKKRAWTTFLEQSPPSADTLSYALARFDCETLREQIHRVYTILQRNHLIRQLRNQGWLILGIDGHELFSSYLRCCDQCCTRRVQTAQGRRFNIIIGSWWLNSWEALLPFRWISNRFDRGRTRSRRGVG